MTTNRLKSIERVGRVPARDQSRYPRASKGERDDARKRSSGVHVLLWIRRDLIHSWHETPIERLELKHVLPPPRSSDIATIESRLIIISDDRAHARASVLHLYPPVAGKDIGRGSERSVRVDLIGAVLPNDDGLNAMR